MVAGLHRQVAELLGDLLAARLGQPLSLSVPVSEGGRVPSEPTAPLGL